MCNVFKFHFIFRWVYKRLVLVVVEITNLIKPFNFQVFFLCIFLRLISIVQSIFAFSHFKRLVQGYEILSLVKSSLSFGITFQIGFLGKYLVEKREVIYFKRSFIRTFYFLKWNGVFFEFIFLSSWLRCMWNITDWHFKLSFSLIKSLYFKMM